MDDRAIPAPNVEWRQKVLGLDEDHHPKVRTMAIAVEWFCRASIRNNRERGHQLYLAGNVGCGKTHLSERARDWIAANQISAYAKGWLHGESIHLPCFFAWERLVAMDQDDYDAVIDRNMEPSRVVILDDVGAEIDRYKSEEPLMRLKQVLDVCKHKWLLITSNIQRRDWEAQFKPRVADRLADCRYVDASDVPSYRGKNKK